jgi:hypothetical protein
VNIGGFRKSPHAGIRNFFSPNPQLQTQFSPHAYRCGTGRTVVVDSALPSYAPEDECRTWRVWLVDQTAGTVVRVQTGHSAAMPGNTGECFRDPRDAHTAAEKWARGHAPARQGWRRRGRNRG